MSGNITLTHEQYAPIQSTKRKIVVVALAGTGKSTVLKAYAHFNPQQRILYVVLNSDNAAAAKSSFPNNVQSFTAHALAYAAIGKYYDNAKKLKNLTLSAINEYLEMGGAWKTSGYVKETVMNFAYSVDSEIGTQHIPTDLDFMHKRMTDTLVSLARKAWAMIVDLKHPMPCTHDCYFKLWALSNPILSYDVICFDEGQDANNIMMQVISAQTSAKIILVGDRNQQIYAFRKSINALDHAFLHDADMYPLTQSFRFGTEVAKVANIILAMNGEKLRVKGFESIVSQVSTTIDYSPGHQGHHYQRAYIHRTVFGTIETALSLADTGEKTFWAGGTKKYKFSELLDVYYLSRNQPEKIENKFIKNNYKDYSTYVQIAEDTFDYEMVRCVKLIDVYGPQLPELISSLESNAAENMSEAAFIVTTAHGSKGLEYEHAILAEDFKSPLLILAESKKRNKGIIKDSDHKRFFEEMCILYVAITRAIYRLTINSAVIDVISEARRRVTKA